MGSTCSHWKDRTCTCVDEACKCWRKSSITEIEVILSKNPPIQQRSLEDPEVVKVQRMIRGYIQRKRLKDRILPPIMLEEGSDSEEIQAKNPISADEVPVLNPIVNTKRLKVPSFAYDLSTLPCDEPKGPVLMTDGSVYVGDWRNGKRYGRGVSYLPDGGLMEGYWSNGLHVKGRTIYVNGDVYEGGYLHGKREGKGRFEAVSGGECYEGEWKADRKQGYGVEKGLDGSSYEGHFESNWKDGKGSLRLQNGDMYIGEFKANHIHGKGKFTWSDGKWYDGDWVEGSMQGHGHLHSEGIDYEGSFRNGQKQGKGTQQWDGNTYEGDFKNGEMHGVGWFSQKDHQKRMYIYENNKRLSAMNLPPS